MDAVVAQGITKTYRAGVGRARVREMVPPPLDTPLRRLFPRWWSKDSFNALEDVSFRASAGTSVGIVGHNGAGKTTLLKVIAGVTSPTEGTVATAARVAALIDVVIGFHPELTGRENVYLLGAMHGFGRRAMEARLDRILDFAEIYDLVDTPLKRYSAGMAGRLGFATITALDVDILLVDEVLAVGDAAFQRKCIGWLDGYRNEGGTLLFVSHNLGLVRNMTQRVLWIDHGRLIEDGPTAEVLGRYARASERRSDTTAFWPGHTVRAMTASGLNRWGAGGARVDEVHVSDPASDGGGVEIAISYEALEAKRGVFCVGFVDEGGREIGAAASPPMPLKARGALRCAISPLRLRTGVYFPVVAILSPEGRVLDRWRTDRPVVVDRNGEAALAESFGPVDMDATWSPRRRSS